MATRYKIFQTNEIYFITFTILGWKKIFISDDYYSLVYKWFDYIKEKYDNKINGYVIMPNHIHCLIKTSEKSPIIPKLIQNAKRFLAYQIVNKLKDGNQSGYLKFFAENAEVKKGAKHKIFTDSYDSLIIQSNKLFLEKLNYIHKNPCQEKWQLVENPEDYKHSSAGNYILDKGFYPVDMVDF